MNIYNAKLIIPLFLFLTFIPVPIGIYSYYGIFRKVFLSKVAARGHFSLADLKLYKCLLITFSFYMLSKAPEFVVVCDHFHLIEWPIVYSRLAMAIFPITAPANAFNIGLLNPDFSPFFKRVLLFGWVKPKSNRISNQSVIHSNNCNMPYTSTKVTDG